MEKALIVVGILLFLYFGLKKLEVKSFGTRNKLEFENIYEFEGFRMNYRTLGEGAPVVLLHGSMYSPPWDGFENKLAEHFKVYTPDMPGFGGSEPIDGHVHNTDLFADAFCEFIKSEDLQESPIISLSLGTVVSAKSASQGCIKGKLMFVGAPSKVSGITTKLLQVTPLSVRRIIVSTRWGKDKLLIPSLNSNIGSKNKEDNSDFIRDLETTDPRSIVDINYLREINIEFPESLKKVDNEIVYIYGENDTQKDEVSFLTKDFIQIDGAGQNIFSSKPDQLLKKLLELLK